jgi:NADPH2:quinone reductase
LAKDRRIAMLNGKGEIYAGEAPIPEVKAGEVLVKVEASLISAGTEISGIRARRDNPSESVSTRTLGYQNAGTIVDKGEGCDKFNIGDRVACMGGGAAHTEYSVVPCNLCVKIPDGVTYEEGAFNHLGATALQAIRRADLQLGEYVTILGLGIVGQIAAQLAQIAGCHVMAVDGVKSRVEKARELGIERAVVLGEEDPVEVMAEFSRGYGMDCGIICFGGEATKAVESLVKMAKKAPDGHQMGRIVIVGGAHISQSFPTYLGNMDIRASSRTGPGYHDNAYEYGRDYPSAIVQWTTQRNLEEIIILINNGKLKVTPLITQRYPLDQVAEGYEKLIQSPNEALGVILKP